MRRFVRPNFGDRIKRISHLLRKFCHQSRCVYEIWAFGSYFRHGPFSDIDLILVTSSRSTNLLKDYYKARSHLKKCLSRCLIPIDFMFLTASEITTIPLRDIHTLRLIYNKNKHSLSKRWPHTNNTSNKILKKPSYSRKNNSVFRPNI